MALTCPLARSTASFSTGSVISSMVSTLSVTDDASSGCWFTIHPAEVNRQRSSRQTAIPFFPLPFFFIKQSPDLFFLFFIEVFSFLRLPKNTF